MTEARPRRSRRRRLIGVAVNAVPWQMDLSTGIWRDHSLDDILSGIRAHADAGEIDLLVLTGLSSEVMTRILERPDSPPLASVLPVELAIRGSTVGGTAGASRAKTE